MATVVCEKAVKFQSASHVCLMLTGTKSNAVCRIFWEQIVPFWVVTPGGGVLPYMGYIGMCGPKGYGFSAVLVINWVSILAILPPFWS